jgi:hypothetical protein
VTHGKSSKQTKRNIKKNLRSTSAPPGVGQTRSNLIKPLGRKLKHHEKITRAIMAQEFWLLARRSRGAYPQDL